MFTQQHVYFFRNMGVHECNGAFRIWLARRIVDDSNQQRASSNGWTKQHGKAMALSILDRIWTQVPMFMCWGKRCSH
jgi:hypothetical protein